MQRLIVIAPDEIPLIHALDKVTGSGPCFSAVYRDVSQRMLEVLLNKGETSEAGKAYLEKQGFTIVEDKRQTFMERINALLQ